MKKILFLAGAIFLNGCATPKIFVNPQRNAEETRKDRDECQKVGNLEKCMQDKGYKLVPESEAKKMQGFEKVWFNPNADFKKYDVIFVDKVDTSQAKHKEGGIFSLLDDKADFEEAAKIAEEMRARFVKQLNTVMPAETDREKIGGRSAMIMSLKLTQITGANVGANVATKVFTGSTFCDASLGMEAMITDADTAQELISLADKHSSDITDGNVSVANEVLDTDSFTRWEGAYKTLDFWADRLAGIIAQKRGQKYESSLIKIKAF